MRWSETIRFNLPVREVRRFAEPLPEKWEDRLREKERQAYEKGRREGEQEAVARHKAERGEINQRLRSLTESLGRAVSDVTAQAHDGLVLLALEAARKIVANVPISRETVEAVVAEALAGVTDSAEIVVQLHPNDLQQLSQDPASPLLSESAGTALRFVPSSELEPGDCLVQTRFGIIDARRHAKFEKLREALIEAAP